MKLALSILALAAAPAFAATVGQPAPAFSIADTSGSVAGRLQGQAGGTGGDAALRLLGEVRRRLIGHCGTGVSVMISA
jgi:hypothetical protein